MTDYLDCRPPSNSKAVFLGERGALTYHGVRAICSNYSAITAGRITAHSLRHSFAHRFLKASNNDLMALAQIRGHENFASSCSYSVWRGSRRTSLILERRLPTQNGRTAPSTRAIRPMETGVCGEQPPASSIRLGDDCGYDVTPLFAIVYAQASNHMAL